MHRVYMQRAEHLSIIPDHSDNLGYQDYREAFDRLEQAFNEKYPGENFKSLLGLAPIGPFVVWNSKKGLPTVYHTQYGKALKEAKRIAAKEAGSEILIMAPYRSVRYTRQYPCEPIWQEEVTDAQRS